MIIFLGRKSKYKIVFMVYRLHVLCLKYLQGYSIPCIGDYG
jgi:hypothetical protein